MFQTTNQFSFVFIFVLFLAFAFCSLVKASFAFSCDVTSKSPVGDISVVTLIRTELHYYNITLHHAKNYTTLHHTTTTTTTTLEIDRQIVSRTEGERERLRSSPFDPSGTTFHVWTIGFSVSRYPLVMTNIAMENHHF